MSRADAQLGLPVAAGWAGQVSPETAFDRQASYRAFADQFYRFEGDRGLFHLELRGEVVWDYIRWAVFYEFFKARNDLAIRGTSKIRRWTRKALALPALAAAWARPRAIGRRYDVILINYARTARVHGRDVNKHMYDLAALLAPRHRVLLIDPHAHRVDRGLYPCDTLALRGLHMLAALRGARTRFTPEERAVLSHIGAAVRTGLGFDVNVDYMAHTIFAYQLHLRDAYTTLLSASGARLLIFCDDLLKKGVVRAGRLVGCRTVEYQHSLVSRLNIVYNYPHGLEAPQLRQTLPDAVFTFGEYWHQDMNLAAPQYCVGFPYFDREFEQHRTPEPAAPDGVLIASSLYERRDLIRTAEALSQSLPAWRIYYKLRSEEYGSWRANYPASLTDAPNVEMIDHDSRPLYHYLARCRYVVGVNSTILVEGLPFGATPIVIQTGWHEEMERLCRDGHMLAADSPAQVVDIVRAGRVMSTPLPREQLFASGSGERVASAVDALLKTAAA
jgi:hypothetical protein